MGEGERVLQQKGKRIYVAFKARYFGIRWY